MKQNNRYEPAGSAGRRRRKNKLMLLLAAFVIMTAAAITVLAVPPLPKTLVNGGTGSSLVPEQQTAQIKRPAPSVRTAEKDEGSNEETAEKNEDSSEGTAAETSGSYAKPVPESEMAENSYFDDAVFIGDSRTEGLILNTGLSNAVLYANKGLMVDTVFTRPVINKNGKKLSVMEALRQTEFSKVYIMLGINETGWPYDSVFIEKYGEIIDEIKAVNSRAVIYVQEILPVSNRVSQTHSYVKNEKIKSFNALIRKMAEEKQIYYIDAGKAVAGTDGCLPEDAAIDGIHLKKPYCEKWLDYLKTHTVTDCRKAG